MIIQLNTCAGGCISAICTTNPPRNHRTTLARNLLHSWLVNLCHDSAHKFKRNFPINYGGFSFSYIQCVCFSLVSKDVSDFVFISASLVVCFPSASSNFPGHNIITKWVFSLDLFFFLSNRCTWAFPPPVQSVENRGAKDPNDISTGKEASWEKYFLACADTKKTLNILSGG